MKTFKLLFLGLILLISSNVSSQVPPTLVKDSLQKLYPTVNTIGWSTNATYYVAGFQYNRFPTKVWFDNQGHWLMKQTDWQVMDEVPEAVYHTFTMGPYSTDEVLDVTLVEFPNKPAQVVVHIGEYNSETSYQLFYLTNGELINARNTTNMSNILGASTFF